MANAGQVMNPGEHLAEFSQLFDMFENAGFQLYAVGGCVRDWCLGKTPKDVDFTTDATPPQTEALLASHGMKVIPLGEAFGTVSTLIGSKSYEITTFRVKESYTKGSRHPMVRYGRDLAQDLERRDLTINAMAMDRHGNVVDPFGGLDDLKSGILRVPRSSYERSLDIFSDDPLRILRLPRFLARLNFKADPDATRAAADAAGTVLTVSHERWFAELDGLLRAPHAAAGLAWLDQVGVTGLLMPEIAHLRESRKRIISLSNDVDIADSSLSLHGQMCALLAAVSQNRLPVWAAFLAFAGFVYARDGESGTLVTGLVADSLLQRLRVSTAFREQTLRLITPLPHGMPDYRTTRETAILIGADLPQWLSLLDARLSCLPPHRRAEESARLGTWKTALSPYTQNPASAPIQWPKGLSRALSDAVGVQGKSLGLCLKFCADSVLNGDISDSSPIPEIVAWAKKHYDPDAM